MLTYGADRQRHTGLAVASVQQKAKVLQQEAPNMASTVKALVHEDSSPITIPSVDSIILPQQLPVTIEKNALLLLINNNILHLCWSTEPRNIPFVKIGGIQVCGGEYNPL